MNVKVLVCCHKDDMKISRPPYMPIHVGKALSNIDLKIQTDNEGDNISDKNGSFCELTGIYWAWKNLKNVDVIGLCHYRRYFDFYNQCKKLYPYTIFNSKDYEGLNYDIPSDVLAQVEKGKVVVARSVNYNMPIYYNYCSAHNSIDLKKIRNLIKTTTDPKYFKAYNDVMMYSNTLHPCNMFLMKWEDFDAYCSWLFPLLLEADKNTDISNYDAYQKRVWGFIGERMFNVWLKAEKKDLIIKPVMWILDEPKNVTPLPRYLARICRNNLHQLFYSVHLDPEQ